MSRSMMLFASLVFFAPAPLFASQLIHHWRFEDNAPLADSVGSANLTVVGSATTSPIPPTGRGSDFQLGIPNGDSGDLTTNGDRFTTNYTPVSGSFTVEAFIHPDDQSGDFGDAIVFSNSGNLSASGIGFTLQLRLDQFAGSAVGEVLFGLSDGSNFVNTFSGLVTQPGNDYYVAAVYDEPADEVTVYLKNLTDNGPLESSTNTVSIGSLNAISRINIGNASDASASWFSFNGLIDEVRLSSAALSESELSIPEPSSVAIVLLGIVGLLALRQNRP